jgi:hypothetical protein
MRRVFRLPTARLWASNAIANAVAFAQTALLNL